MTKSQESPEAAESLADSRAGRTPQQERGQRRVDQILDAAESVFAEQGVDAVSMQLIADRAESSIGSLYHFFPNKDAITEALGERYAERSRQTNEEAMPLEMAHLPVEELFERVLSAQMRFIERTPAFGTVQEAVKRYCPMIHDTLNHAIAGHVEQFLALRYPRQAADLRWATALVSVVTVHAIVEFACQVPAAQRALVLREGKAMLVSHFGALDREA